MQQIKRMCNIYHGGTRCIPVPPWLMGHHPPSSTNTRGKHEVPKARCSAGPWYTACAGEMPRCQPPLLFVQKKGPDNFFNLIPVRSSPFPPPPPPGRKIPPRGKHCCNLFWFSVKCKSLVFFHWKFFSDAFFQICLEAKFAFPLLACESPRCQAARRNAGFDTGEQVILQEMSSPWSSTATEWLLHPSHA